MLKLFIFFFWTLCDAAYLPSLKIVYERKRHFELWVLCFDILARLCFNTCTALDVDAVFFIQGQDWHVVSDIMSETVVTLILIHLMGLRSNDLNTLLRYVAFSLLWLAKRADGWDSIRYELAVFIMFGLPTLARMLGVFSPPPPYKWNMLGYAVACGVGSTLVLQLGMLFDSLIYILVPIGNIGFSASVYFAFNAVQCMDKKDDDSPTLPFFT